jgi:hypothetical protein
MPKVQLANHENTPAPLELEPGQASGVVPTQLTFDFFAGPKTEEDLRGSRRASPRPSTKKEPRA